MQLQEISEIPDHFLISSFYFPGLLVVLRIGRRRRREETLVVVMVMDLRPLLPPEVIFLFLRLLLLFGRADPQVDGTASLPPAVLLETRQLQPVRPLLLLLHQVLPP